MAWMAWTGPTALFFALIALALVLMTLAEVKWPTRETRGWLPISTTRGDRFFISLLSAAYVHLAWLAALDLPVAYASIIALLLAFLIMRWG
jgi:predicted small integral membrane protein